MKPFFSRRHFCASLAFGLLVFAAAPLRAQSDGPLDTNAADDLSAQTLHDVGVRMLREGRTFEKAAARFALAAQKEPGAASHPIGRGCALASRAASLSHASLFTQVLARKQAEHPEKLKQWEEGRADWENGKAQSPQVYAYQKYDDQKPELPPPYNFFTKDDKAPFRLTPGETAARLSELSEQAQKAWEQGIALSKTPDEKAGAYYMLTAKRKAGLSRRLKCLRTCRPLPMR